MVLVGVSRASKSSTCFHLAYEGVRAPMRPLLELDPQKVIGLRVNVMRLMTVREARAFDIGLDQENVYMDKATIAREGIDANRQMERYGWRSFDASYMAIEEVAKEVMRLRDLRS